MTLKELRHLLKADVDRISTNNKEILRAWLFNDMFKVTALCRIDSYLRGNRVLKPFHVISYWLLRHYRYKTGIQVWPGTAMGGASK